MTDMNPTFKDNEKAYKKLRSLYLEVYGHNAYEDGEKSLTRLISLMDRYHQKRKKAYIKRDEDNYRWFLKRDVVGMTMYVDLFSGDIQGFFDKIDYLKDLGVTFIHFMPILQGRPRENDGGYAVMDYKKIDSRFGDFSIFEKLLKKLHDNGMYGCVDFVVNHTAKEHEWAQKAIAGDKKYMDMYYMYEDDTIPPKFEKTMLEVFPKVSPGNDNYY